jgi:excisionase family DNA binding protein
MQNKMLKVSELAEILNIAPTTIYHWVMNKEIPYYKIGTTVRFNLDDVMAWIEARKKSEVKEGK